ncbi:hypothetical protein ACWA2B_10260 [Paenibacillus sp. CMM36]
MNDIDIEKIDNPTWSGEIKSILEDVEDGIFNIDADENDQMGADWWYLKINGEVAGLLWIVCEEDEMFYENQAEIAEISFCFRKDYRRKGMLNSLIEQVSSLVVSDYAKATLILAVVKKTNPFLEAISRTLQKNGYLYSENGKNVLLEKEIGKSELEK